MDQSTLADLADAMQEILSGFYGHNEMGSTPFYIKLKQYNEMFVYENGPEI